MLPRLGRFCFTRARSPLVVSSPKSLPFHSISAQPISFRPSSNAFPQQKSPNAFVNKRFCSSQPEEDEKSAAHSLTTPSFQAITEGVNAALSNEFPNIVRLRKAEELKHLAQSQLDSNNPVVAEFVFEQCLLLFREYKNKKFGYKGDDFVQQRSSDLGDIYSHLAYTKHKLGKLEEAKTHYETALSLMQGHAEYAMDYVHTCMNLSEIYNHLEDPESALKLSMSTLPLVQSLYAEKNQEMIGGCFSNMAAFHCKLKQHVEATECLFVALEIFKTTISPYHPKAQVALNLILELLAHLDDEGKYNQVRDEWLQFHPGLPSFDQKEQLSDERMKALVQADSEAGRLREMMKNMPQNATGLGGNGFPLPDQLQEFAAAQGFQGGAKEGEEKPDELMKHFSEALGQLGNFVNQTPPKAKSRK